MFHLSHSANIGKGYLYFYFTIDCKLKWIWQQVHEYLLDPKLIRVNFFMALHNNSHFHVLEHSKVIHALKDLLYKISDIEPRKLLLEFALGYLRDIDHTLWDWEEELAAVFLLSEGVLKMLWQLLIVSYILVGHQDAVDGSAEVMN